MKYDDFISEVAERARMDRDRAEAFTKAVLFTLGERLARGEADDLVAQLPSELRAHLIAAPPEAQRFDLTEFLLRVEERAGAVNRVDAERGARAVMTTLRHATTAGEFEDVLAQLPDEFRSLVDLSVASAGP